MRWSDELAVEDCPGLQSLSGFDSLTNISGRLFLFNNAALTSLDGFPKLERIDGPLVVDSNRALTEITGFENLEYVDGAVYFKNNSNLSRCEIEKFVEGIDTITGEVVIEDNGGGSCSE